MTTKEKNELQTSAKGTGKPPYGKTTEELLTPDPKNQEQIVQQWPVEGTPFTTWKYKDEYFLSLGKYRLSEHFKTKEEADEDAKDASWERIMQIIKIMIQEHDTEQKNLIQKLRDEIGKIEPNFNL